VSVVTSVVVPDLQVALKRPLLLIENCSNSCNHCTLVYESTAHTCMRRCDTRAARG